MYWLARSAKVMISRMARLNSRASYNAAMLSPTSIKRCTSSGSAHSMLMRLSNFFRKNPRSGWQC